MPRMPRFHSESGIYHVMIRGLDRSQLFYDDDDRMAFMERLDRYRQTCGVKMYAWCLMSNHVHLLLKLGATQLAAFMKRLLLSYSHFFNSKYDRVGYLFQDRFKSNPVDDDTYFLSVLRYILRNPLEVGEGLGYWTSYRETLSGSGLVDGDYILSLFSLDPHAARAFFEAFVSSAGSDDCEILGQGTGRGIKDADAVRAIKALPGIHSCQDVCNLSSEKRDQALRELRDKGLSIRQISRLTGLNRGIVERSRKRVGG